MSHLINAAIQLLPLDTVSDRIGIIDKAIAAIQASGLPYKVCPFETVVEGRFAEVSALLDRIQQVALDNGTESMLINVKYHIANKDLHFEDKLSKYPDQK